MPVRFFLLELSLFLQALILFSLLFVAAACFQALPLFLLQGAGEGSGTPQDFSLPNKQTGITETVDKFPVVTYQQSYAFVLPETVQQAYPGPSSSRWFVGSSRARKSGFACSATGQLSPPALSSTQGIPAQGPVVVHSEEREQAPRPLVAAVHGIVKIFQPLRYFIGSLGTVNPGDRGGNTSCPGREFAHDEAQQGCFTGTVFSSQSGKTWREGQTEFAEKRKRRIIILKAYIGYNQMRLAHRTSLRAVDMSG